MKDGRPWLKIIQCSNQWLQLDVADTLKRVMLFKVLMKLNIFKVTFIYVTIASLFNALHVTFIRSHNTVLKPKIKLL